MFSWWTNLKIKWAKKILNKKAPKNEFIAYINKHEELKLKKWGGSGQRTHKTGIKSFFLDRIISWGTSVVTGATRALSNESTF